MDWSNLKLQLFFSFDFPEMSIKLNSRSMILALRNPAKKLSGKVQYYRKSISTFPIKFSKWKSFCFSSERLFLTEERAIVFVHISNVSIWRPLKIVIRKKGKEKNRQEQTLHYICRDPNLLQNENEKAKFAAIHPDLMSFNLKCRVCWFLAELQKI